MYNLHDNHERRMPQQMAYENSAGTGSTRGSLIALLVLVVLLGGLIVFSSLNSTTITEDDGATGAAVQDDQSANPQAGTGIVTE